MSKKNSNRFTSRTLPYVLMISVLLAATALRTYNFNNWPPGLSQDEAINGIDAVRFLRTGIIPFYILDGRPEPLFRFCQVITIALVGPTRFGLRLASLYTGVLGVAAAYRAGRHLVPRGNGDARRWAGLLSASVIAVMVGHIHLSRVAYRAIPVPLAMLLFCDAFITGWETNKQRSFAAAGVWLAVSMLSYTAGLILLPIAGMGVLHQAIVRFKRRREWWRGLLFFILAFVVAISPLVMLLVVQPELYWRASEVGGISRGTLAGQLGRHVSNTIMTWQMVVYRIGDINPQYNVARTPLLHIKPLYWLLLLGVIACVLRPRRLASWLAGGLLVGALLPVSLSQEIPHGLRVVGEYAAIPLVIAASIDPILWLIRRLPTHARVTKGLELALALVVCTMMVVASVMSGQIYTDYFQEDVRWGEGGVISAFSWFFETRHLAIAEVIAAQDDVIYVPLSEAEQPPLRYFTTRSHPNVETFATHFTDNAPLVLPAGQFLIAPQAEEATTFVAFMPDGTLVLLPRFNEATLTELRVQLAASSETIQDDHGEYAATVIQFPADGSDIVLDTPVSHVIDVNYAGQIGMVGWDGPSTLPEDGGPIETTLYFSPSKSRCRDVTIFSQLWTPNLERVASSSEVLLHRWLYPPAQWQPGDIVPFTSPQDVPEGLKSGAYYLAVGLRDYRTQHLPVIGVEGDAVADVAIAGMLKIPYTEAVSTEGMIPVDAEFGDEIGLLGYRLYDGAGKPVEVLAPGQPGLVTIYWQAIRQPGANYTVFLHVSDGDEQLVAQSDIQPDDGWYPTSIWSVGEIVTTTHWLTIPPDSTGPFTLYTGLYSWPSLERLTVIQGGQTVEDRRATLGAFSP